MDGLLIVDKPAGMTSHDVVNRVRRILGTRRVGHTGTLDPFATGVLVLMIGSATRLAQFVDKDEKEYDALLQLGWETDTGDLTGEARPASLPPDAVEQLVSETNWNDVLKSFHGRIKQTPPMYSAKKVKGQRLYELARQNVEIARAPVDIEISKLDLVSIAGSRVRIRVACSAGTYIRTLAEDIGRKARTRAHLVELRRIRAGKFRIEDAVTLDRIGDAAEPSVFLRGIEEAVDHLQPINLSSARSEKTRSGLATFVDDPLENGEPVRMLDNESRLIAIGIYDSDEKSVKPKIVLV